ncbi:MAG: hypothetical protein FWD33_01995 [Alphaproteobacteria bacterium]|nr:hypothetical protein [Alphaproteobacteria bacterium]
MKKLAIIAAAAAMAMPLQANAIGIYAGVSGGQGNAYFSGNNFSNTNFSELGVHAGAKVMFARAEIEYARMFGSDIAAGLGMINFYGEPFPFIPFLSPYFGAGFGRVFDAKVDDVKLSGNNAAQAMLGTGLSFPGFPVRFDAELRSIFTGKLKPKDSSLDIDGANMITLGVRIKASYVF